MADSAEHRTSPTLLGRLRAQPRDEAAWNDFESRYGRMIREWCRRWGLQPLDAEDVAQDVMVQLARQMAAFQYDPAGKFRGWLKTVAYRAWCDFLASRRKRGDQGSGDTGVLDLLETAGAERKFVAEMEEEWNRELLEEALRRVRARVRPHTFEVFRLMTQDDLSGAAVAERLGMNVGAVWVAKSKVQKMIHEEIQKLDTA